VDALAHGYAVDSTMAPSLIHMVQAANSVGDPALVRLWTDRYLALDSTSTQAEAFRLAAAIRFGTPAESAAATGALDTAELDVLTEMATFWLSDSTGLPYFESVLGALSDARFPNGARARALRTLGAEYLRHGQVGKWHETEDRAEGLLGARPSLSRAALARVAGMADDSVSRATFDRLMVGVRYPEDAPFLSLVYAKEGRLAEAERGALEYQRNADSLMAAGDTARGRRSLLSASVMYAHIAAARGEAAEAVDHLRRGLSLMVARADGRDEGRFLLATFLEARGGEEEALRIYGSLEWSPWLEAQGFLRAAKLRQRMGQEQEALQDYRRFLGLWQDADPQFQQQVASARAAAAELAGKLTNQP